MDRTLCPHCKEQLAINLTIGSAKRQKLDPQEKFNPMNFGSIPPGRNLLKAILVFLGVAGVVTLAFSPIMDLKGVSLIQSQTSTSFKYD
jgi:hypothetical protein